MRRRTRIAAPPAAASNKAAAIGVTKPFSVPVCASVAAVDESAAGSGAGVGVGAGEGAGVGVGAEPPAKVAVPWSPLDGNLPSEKSMMKVRFVPTLIVFAAKVTLAVSPVAKLSGPFESRRSTTIKLVAADWQPDIDVTVVVNHEGQVPSLLNSSGLTNVQPIGKLTRNLLATLFVTAVAVTVMGKAFVPVVPIVPGDVAVTLVRGAA